MEPASFQQNVSTAYYVLGTVSLWSVQIKWKIRLYTIRRKLKLFSPYSFLGLPHFSFPPSPSLSTAQTLVWPQWPFGVYRHLCVHTQTRTLYDPHGCSTHTTVSYPRAIRGKIHLNNEFPSSLRISIYGNLLGSGSCSVPVAAGPLGSSSTQALPTEQGTGNYTGNRCPDNHQRAPLGGTLGHFADLCLRRLWKLHHGTAPWMREASLLNFGMQF